MSAPLVSIIITCYGYERYVQTCIDSCLNQRGTVPFEVIFVDDGSPDSSLAAARSREPEVRVFSIANSGVEAASNFGFSQARGKYLVRVDVDDRLEPDFLSGMAPYLEREDWSFLYADYSRIDGEGRILSRVELPAFDVQEIRGRGDFLATGTVYRTAQLLELGGYDESVRNCGLENFELILRLLSTGRPGLHVALPLFQYRIHSQNMSLLRRERIIEHGQRVAKRFALSSYSTNSNHPYQLSL